jgi:hypothetical protein
MYVLYGMYGMCMYVCSVGRVRNCLRLLLLQLLLTKETIPVLKNLVQTSTSGLLYRLSV